MKQTIAQNAAEREGYKQTGVFEKPQYCTTKDMHFPVSSF